MIKNWFPLAITCIIVLLVITAFAEGRRSVLESMTCVCTPNGAAR